MDEIVKCEGKENIFKNKIHTIERNVLYGSAYPSEGLMTSEKYYCSEHAPY